MSLIKEHIRKQSDQIIEELSSWLRIPSISTLPSYKKDIERSAEWLRDAFINVGAENVRLIRTNGNPLVFAECFVDKNLPTILVYGHYDVQPIDPISLWENPPFHPVVKKGKIYARGASDDKGPVFAHVKALELMRTTSMLACNVKYLIEGEEEIGSAGIYDFLQEQKNLDLIKADVVVVSDTAFDSMENPSLPIALRGIVALRVEVEGANRDLHSGVYGGAVANPIQVLATMLSQLKNEQQEVVIPGFYDDVKTFSQEERQKINEGFDVKSYQQNLAISTVYGEKGYTTLERVGIRPALDVNGICGGYTAEGVKMVLPSVAHATLSIRLVPSQDPMRIAQCCKSYLLSLAPKGVSVKVTIYPGRGSAFMVSPNSLGIKAAERAFEQVWYKKPKLCYEGGSIPILSILQQKLKKDVILLGFGLNGDNIHSPNEHFGLNNLYLGIETIIAFFQEFAKMNMGD